MIDIATWRARIGSFNVATGGTSGMRAKLLPRPSSAREWSLLLALTTTVVEVLTIFIVLLMIMLAGDVERNPGPGKGEENYSAVNDMACLCMCEF